MATIPQKAPTVGKFTFQGLAALDQLIATFDGQDEEARASAYRQARDQLEHWATNETNATIRRIYLALRTLAEKEANE